MKNYNRDILNRKGARKAQDIPHEVLHLLNKGEIESVNLMEWLTVDHIQLIESVLPHYNFTDEVIHTISDQIRNQKTISAMKTTKLIGEFLYNHYEIDKNIDSFIKELSKHRSDSIRCYAPYLIALNRRLSIREKLERSRPLIADKHFGVREVVWMALRPEIDNNLSESIDILSDWTTDRDENIRRFSTEATRPRGVWCKHIDALKEDPQLALSILEGLKSDSSKYVQDSVGNWLNDASKTDPEFVIDLCDRWLKESPTKETEKIIKRGKRTIDKK